MTVRIPRSFAAHVRHALLAKRDDERERDVCAPFARWRDDPEGFVEHHFGERAWSAQTAAWEELRAHQRVAWRSGRKTGKTRWISWVVPWFLCTRPSIVITLGASWDQVRNVLWAGVGELHGLAAQRGRPLPGVVDATQWRLGPRHFAIGRSTDSPGRIQGFHGSAPMPADLGASMSEAELDELIRKELAQGAKSGVDLLVICDELIKDELLHAISGSVQGPNAYWVLAFNPMIEASSSHMCARVFHDPGPWRRIAVHPEPVEDPVGADRRFTSIPVGLQRPSWRAECERQWGKDSALYRAHVLGLFAGAASERQLISEALLIASEQREVYADVGVHVGIDLSRSDGGDECVASRWAYGVKTAEYTWRSADAMRSAEIVAALRVKWGEPDGPDGEPVPLPASHIHVDATGLGGPVADRLHQMGLYVDAVDFGASPAYDWQELIGETEFLNRRAELHWVYRRAFEEGIAKLPRKFADSWRQAQWPEWEPRVRAGATVIAIEPKEDVVERHGRSPDHMDADLLAWARTSAELRVWTLRR